MAKIDVEFCQYLSRFGCLYYSTEKNRRCSFIYVVQNVADSNRQWTYKPNIASMETIFCESLVSSTI